MRTVKARNLMGSLIVLADGAVITHLSFQLNWVYATGTKNGRYIRRRYRYDQDVKLSEEAQ